jgi:hypothetical protein
MLKNDVGSTSHINVEPMLMQRLFNVESMLMQRYFNVESMLMQGSIRWTIDPMAASQIRQFLPYLISFISFVELSAGKTK